MSDEPQRSSMVNAFWRCRRYLLPQWPHFTLFLLLTGFGLVLNTGIAMFSADLLMNKVFLGEPLNSFQAAALGLDESIFVDVEKLSESARFEIRMLFLVLMASLVVLQFLLGQGMRYYQTWILQRVNQDLRVAMMDNAIRLSLRFHHKNEVGDAIYRVYQDSAMIVAVFQTGVLQPIILVGTFAFVITIVAAFNIYLALLFAVAVVPSILLAKLMTAQLRQRSLASRTANSALTSHIQESIQGSKLLKALNAERRTFTSFVEKSQFALDRAYELRKSVVLLNLGVFFSGAVVTLLADYFMVHLVWEGDTTAGYGVIAAVGFAIWNLGAYRAAREHIDGASGALVGMAFTWSLLQDMGVGLQRAMFLVDVEPEIQDAKDAVQLENEPIEVKFQNVSFGYEPSNTVLQNVSFAAQPSTVTAIVGGSGAGKSTLMSLLIRLYEVEAGEITINGRDIRTIKQDSLRNAVSVVLQENALFPATIEENIRFAVPDADGDSLENALRVSCADEFVNELPEGLATELGERGAKLSTGQRQRLSIARAIVKRAPILILDEPTASLDVKTEERLLRNINEWAHDKVVFLITHRVTSTLSADQIVFLEGGRSVEIGTPAELLEKEGGHYRAYVSAETVST